MLIGPLGWRGLLVSYAAIMLLVNLPMIWLLVPPAPPRPHVAPGGAVLPARTPRKRLAVVCLGAFFAVRWFITSAIAVHVLDLLGGIGLTAAQAVLIAAMVGLGQVAGRIMEWVICPRIDTLVKPRVAAALFPLGAMLLLAIPWIGPLAAAIGFVLMFGMSNGIMTINRGTLPLAMFGAEGYARILGWLAVPVLFGQALAPAVTAPLVTVLSPLHVLLLSGAAAGGALLLLLPLRLPVR